MFYDIAALILTILMLAIFFAAIEIGFLFGHRRQSRATDYSKTHINSLQAALLGLLALLLGFTFAMAMSRYETRRDLVIAESNAINTTYLRAQLLADPHREKLTQGLRAYVEARLAFYDAGTDDERITEANTTSAHLQEQLWKEAIVLAEKDPQSVPMGLFAQSLNDLSNLQEKRTRAMENHVPSVIPFLVFVVAAVAFGFIGYNCGLATRRHFVSTALVAVVVTFVLGVIIDLDQPRHGLIKVSQNSMLRLKETLK